MAKDMIDNGEVQFPNAADILSNFGDAVKGIMTSYGDVAAEQVMSAARNVVNTVAQAKQGNIAIEEAVAVMTDPTGAGETVSGWPPEMRDALAPIIGTALDGLDQMQRHI